MTTTTPGTISFSVTPGAPASWPGMGAAGRVVSRFLSGVRVTGDPQEAVAVMAPEVPAHQVVSDEPHTVIRTPQEYAGHVREMLAAFGHFHLDVDDVLEQGDRVFVRWRQVGHHLGKQVIDVGSAVYRVQTDVIAEYWIQLDRLGLVNQLDGQSYSSAATTLPSAAATTDSSSRPRCLAK